MCSIKQVCNQQESVCLLIPLFFFFFFYYINAINLVDWAALQFLEKIKCIQEVNNVIRKPPSPEPCELQCHMWEIANTLRESFAYSQVSSRATDGDYAHSLSLALGSTDEGLTPITPPNKHAPTTDCTPHDVWFTLANFSLRISWRALSLISDWLKSAVFEQKCISDQLNIQVKSSNFTWNFCHIRPWDFYFMMACLLCN